jgi:PKD repeat protein
MVLDFGGLAVDPTAPERAVLAHAIVGGPTGGAQFVWEDGRADSYGQFDILTAAVAVDTTLGASVPISTSARAQLRLDFAVGNNQVLAVYLSEHSGDRKIVGQRLDALGGPLDLEPFEIASGQGIGTPHVGFDGTRYLVVWSDDGQTYGKRVLPDGNLIDATPLSIMDSESPDVAGHNGSFLVVGTRPTIGAHFVHPFSMRVDGGTGATLDPGPVILGQYYARFPRVIAFGGRWLATWQRNISHDNPNSSAWAAFVEPDGTTLGEFNYGSGGGTPDVATSGDRALFVSRSFSPGSGHNDVYGRLMLANGTLVGDAFPISAAPSPTREFDPAVTWNGTEFVIAWTDERSEVIYFDARTEVFAARVLPDGTVVDPAGFAIGDIAEQEILPAVTSIGGRTIIAASSFRDDPPLQAYRIAYQVFGDSPLGNGWPVAVASGVPSSGDVSLMVSFSAAGSTDPDGSIAAYDWDFGDGTAPGVGANPTHTYTDAGEYIAELTVTDNQGASTSNTLRVVATAVNGSPVAVATANLSSGPAPLSVVYQAAGSYDPDDGIAQIFWDFGDGGTYYGGTAYHTYSVPGNWLTTLTITDHSGASADDTLTITVGAPNQPPVAVAAATTPLSGFSPLTVTFDPSGSNDPDGTITGYLWDFGDGVTSTDAIPSHVYELGGSYEVVLTVTDNEGASGTDSLFIDVTQGDFITVADADFATEAGVVTAGSYATTQDGDGVYQELTEEETGGKPSKRRSRLSHTWRFDVIPEGPNHRFYVDAHHTANTEADDFVFEYSDDGVDFAPMVVVGAVDPAAEGVGLQSFSFAEDVSGTLYVRVTDTDRSPGNNGMDTLYVDEMFVVTSWQDSGDTTPPAAPTGLLATAGDGTVSLDWADNAETDLSGYQIYRASQSGGAYAQLTGAPVTASAYVDGDVVNGTTYYYVVTAVDTSEYESANSVEASATPQATGGATSMHVANIVVTSAKAVRGARHGVAEVIVVDDQGTPVDGAEVSGSFTGDLTETQTQPSGADGVALFTTTDTKKGGLNLTFCVTGVSDASLIYESASNAETCDSL